MRNTTDRIRHYLSNHPEGCTSSELARDILSLTKKSEKQAQSIVAALLKDEDDIRQDDNGLWVLHSILTLSPQLDSARIAFVAGRTARGRSDTLIEVACVVPGRDGGSLEIHAGRLSRDDCHGEELPAETYYADLSAVLDAIRQCDAIVVRQKGGFWNAFRSDAFLAGGLPERDVIDLSDVGKRILGAARRPRPEEMAAELGIPWREGDSCCTEAENLSSIYYAILPAVFDHGVTTVQELLEYCRPRKKPVDFSKYDFDRAFVDELPMAPGVYVMRNSDGQVIYVGKSKRLKERVLSYFVDSEGRPKKETRLLRQLRSLKVHLTGSELSALLLEQELIERKMPSINTQRFVHERETPSFPEQNFIVFLPAADAECIEAFLIADDLPVQRIVFRRDLQDMDDLKRAVAEMFFPDDQALDSSDRLKEANREIVLSWYVKYRNSVDIVDVDQAGSLDNIMRLTADLVHFGKDDPPGTRRV